MTFCDFLFLLYTTCHYCISSTNHLITQDLETGKLFNGQNMYPYLLDVPFMLYE